MIVDSPKMRKRLEVTYATHKRKPRELAARLAAVFDNDNTKTTAFVKAMVEKKDWRESIGQV